MNKQQENILLLLGEAWAVAPDLRFGQLLEVAFGECNRHKCIFSESDHKFEHVLESHIKHELEHRVTE